MQKPPLEGWGRIEYRPPTVSENSWGSGGVAAYGHTPPYNQATLTRSAGPGANKGPPRWSRGWPCTTCATPSRATAVLREGHRFRSAEDRFAAVELPSVTPQPPSVVRLPTNRRRLSGCPPTAEGRRDPGKGAQGRVESAAGRATRRHWSVDPAVPLARQVH